MAKLRQIDLIENFSLAPAADYKVDRERCILYGVKVLGRESPNCHGLSGISGTVYTMEAMEEALPLYEGAKINADHPPRSTPNAERTIRDRLGKLFNARLEDDGIYADLHLIPSKPITAEILDCAESDLKDLFALSHNAQGKGEVEGNKFVVRSLPYLRSVDLVADAATARSLFESKEQKQGNKMGKTTTLRESIARSKSDKLKNKFARLLEDDDYANMSVPDMADDETADADAAPPPMDAGAADAAPPPTDASAAAPVEATAADPDAGLSDDHQEHLANMIRAICNDAEMSAEEKAEKIIKAVKLLEDGANATGVGDSATPPPFGDEGSETESEEDTGKDKGKDTDKGKDSKGKDSDKDSDKDKDAMEARERAELDQYRREGKVRQLCESSQFVGYDEIEFKALCALGDEDRKTFIRKAKERRGTQKAPARGATAPTTPLPKHITESREEVAVPGTNKNAAERLAYWRS